MSDWDLLVVGARIVGDDGVRAADVAAAEGKVVRVGAGLQGSAREVVDASGKFLFPGIVDAHVHFNEPGRTDWEGIETGSRALAAGGGTVFCDMPLNSEPPVLDAAAFETKRKLGEAKSRVDFALWGGLVPGNLGHLPELAAAGAIGLKAFMCGSGIASFPRADPATLKAGMALAAKLGLLVAVHAEDEEITGRLTAAARAQGRESVRAYLDSRPVDAETAAIRLAAELAGETGCRLHVVHVSSPEGLDAVLAARRAGADISAETCPHYLLLNDRDVERIGALAKCSPPIRGESARRDLWRRLRAGDFDTLGSDHSPSPPALKEGRDFFAIWGGIAGVQHGMELVLSEAERDDWPLLSRLLAGNVARRFRLPAKAGIREGCDADFSILAANAGRIVTAEELLTRHRVSPYVGRSCRIRFERTYLRGRLVSPAGPAAPSFGRWLRPSPG